METQELQKAINEFGEKYGLTEREKAFVVGLLSKVPPEKIEAEIIAQFVDIIREGYD